MAHYSPRTVSDVEALIAASGVVTPVESAPLPRPRLPFGEYAARFAMSHKRYQLASELSAAAEKAYAKQQPVLGTLYKGASTTLDMQGNALDACVANSHTAHRRADEIVLNWRRITAALTNASSQSTHGQDKRLIEIISIYVEQGNMVLRGSASAESVEPQNPRAMTYTHSLLSSLQPSKVQP